jgi:hypothetical protein
VSQLGNIGVSKVRIKLTSGVSWVIACRITRCTEIEALEVIVILETEDVLPEEQESDENNDLVDCLPNDVTIHHRVKDVFVDGVRLV